MQPSHVLALCIHYEVVICLETTAVRYILDDFGGMIIHVQTVCTT